MSSSSEVLGWLALLQIALGVVGYVFICIDYDQKIDELRAIDERVWRERLK